MIKIATQVTFLTNIQRYSINDGPGIRTTVFLKGCTLNCKWCHNPECIRALPEIYFVGAKCRRCGLCNAICPVGAIFPPSYDPMARKIDREKCDRCLKCVEVCPFGGLAKVGFSLSLEEVLDEVRRDWLFYEDSGGGITVSGGEPLFQPDFTREFLKCCKEERFHTCLDTCAYAEWEVIEHVLPYVDLALCDLKHMDSIRHFEETGVLNELILDNIKKIADRVPVRIRLPLIPGFNDSPENIEKTVKFVRSLSNVEGVDILPFHVWAEAKYRKLEKVYAYADTPDMTEEEARKAEEIFKGNGLQTTIGG